MKTFRFFATLLVIALCTGFTSCSSSLEKQMNFAENVFIREVSYMSETDALSREVNHYKAPEITVKYHKRSLTGKELIHECNTVIEKNEESLSKGGILVRTYYVSDIKEYALNHPEDIIANEFEFCGTFTHFEPDKYVKKSAAVIVVSKLEKYILTPID